MRSRSGLLILGLVILAGAVALYWAFDPERGIFPKCPFYALTGLQCPGCGSQRAVHDLLHGDILSAWRHNWILIPGLVLVVAMFAAKWGNWERWNKFFAKTGFIWTVLAIIIAYWIGRNVW